jgi:tetratricopeptide (TPR) repeat protein
MHKFAKILIRERRASDALKLYQALLDMDSLDLSARLGIAACLSDQARFDDALKAYEELANAFPNDVTARSGLAETLVALNRFQEALSVYMTIVQHFSENIIGHLGCADVLAKMGRYRDAIQEYDHVLRNFPGHSGAKSARARAAMALGLSDERLDDRVRSLLQTIARTSRQEERLAILLSALFADQRLGMEVLKYYASDRAVYATRVLEELSKLLNHGADGRKSLDPIEARLASRQKLLEVAWSPFSGGMPWNKARLLFFFALHLAEYPEANQFVQDKLNRTRSIYVESERGKIQHLLDRANAHS